MPHLLSIASAQSRSVRTVLILTRLVTVLVVLVAGLSLASCIYTTQGDTHLEEEIQHLKEAKQERHLAELQRKLKAEKAHEARKEILQTPASSAKPKPQSALSDGGSSAGPRRLRELEASLPGQVGLVIGPPGNGPARERATHHRLGLVDQQGASGAGGPAGSRRAEWAQLDPGSEYPRRPDGFPTTMRRSRSSPTSNTAAAALPERRQRLTKSLPKQATRSLVFPASAGTASLPRPDRMVARTTGAVHEPTGRRLRRLPRLARTRP